MIFAWLSAGEALIAFEPIGPMQKCSFLSTTPSAAAGTCAGFDWSSACSSVSFAPPMPPWPLISSIASLAPATNSAYTVASGPVNEEMKPIPTSPESLRLLAAGLRAAAGEAAAEAAAEAAGAAVAARVAATVVATAAWLAADGATVAAFLLLPLLLLLQPAIARPKRPALNDAVPRTNRRREIGRQYRSAIAPSALCFRAPHAPALARAAAPLRLPACPGLQRGIAAAPRLERREHIRRSGHCQEMVTAGDASRK